MGRYPPSTHGTHVIHPSFRPVFPHEIGAPSPEPWDFNPEPQTLNPQVLLEHVEDLDRAHEYATKVEEPEVWSELAHAELERGAIANAIGSYLRANDASRRAPSPERKA